MIPPDDVIGEMRKFPFDDSGADAFLSGRVHPDDAPPGFEDAAMLVQAAKAPIYVGAVVADSGLIAECSAAIRENRGISPVTQRRRSMLASAMTVKAAAIAAAVLLSGGVAAAATGALPASFQTSVSKDVSHVGLHIPDPDSHASPHALLASGNAKGKGSGHRPALSATSPDAYGLCTAYAASSKGTSSSSGSTDAQANSTAFARLAAAAAFNKESVAKFCATVTPPSGVKSGPPIGVKTGQPSGVTTGPPIGVRTGQPSGVTTRPPTGVKTGQPTGVTTGPPTGSSSDQSKSSSSAPRGKSSTSSH